MTLVLHAYCNLRYGTAFACEMLAEDPPYDPELLLKEFPESQKAGAEQNQPIDIFEGKPDRIRLRLDRASLIEAAALTRAFAAEGVTVLEAAELDEQ